MKLGRPRHPARIAAQSAGNLFYIGPLCKRGHAMRYVINAGCVQCHRALQNQWYHRTKDRPREQALDARPLADALRRISELRCD